ncbi:MAG TPA: hypothetical protein VKD71_15860, partial [Gemmataceae bacterium]|nr:hypothetical protein [Gemmataceae bacterium]
LSCILALNVRHPIHCILQGCRHAARRDGIQANLHVAAAKSSKCKENLVRGDTYGDVALFPGPGLRECEPVNRSPGIALGTGSLGHPFR